MNERGNGLREATVEVYSFEDSATAIRSGVTEGHGYAHLGGLEAGSYRVAAGHQDYLEGRRELTDFDPKDPETRAIQVVTLPDGAEVRLRTHDPAGEPLPGVELTVERLGEAPDTLLQAADFLEAKRYRTAVTDHSGRASIRGLYPGTYLTRARLRGERGTRGVIALGADGDDLERELEIEIAGTETVSLVGRMLPAASLSASLVCSDGWDLPDTVAVRVIDAYGAEPRDFDLGEAAGAGPELAFADDAVLLGGRLRDRLTVGPFEQGVYYLALKPDGFDRWTWAFETHDADYAAKLQIDLAEGSASEGSGALVDIDLGQLQVECAPAIDLLPEVAGATPEGKKIAFPDVREVTVSASFFDLEIEKEVKRRLSIIRRDGRIRLRDCPGGQLRLDFTLAHPHLLPEPELTWQLEIELERGDYREIVPEVEALGGSIRIAGAGASATLRGPDGVERRVSFENGEAEIASLIPGRYRLEVSGPEDEPIRVWRVLEVRAGEMLRLDVETP